MSLSAEPIIYGLIFIGVLVLVEGLYLTVFGRSISLDSRVNRRLEMLDKSGNREEVMEKLRKEMEQHLKARRVPLYAILSTKAQKAAIAFSPKQIVLIMVATAILAFIGLSIGTETGFAVRVLASAAMGIGGVYLWISMKAAKRMTMLEEQLPDAIELMVRSLRVGHPFSAAIGIVATEVADPIATEFGMISDEATYGRDIGEALKDMAERLDMQDLRFLAVAVAIQQQAGGNLAEILDGLAKVIRARFRLFRRVKAITAEAQWSGNFLSGFPLLALVGIQLLKPDHYDDAMQSPYFIPAALVVGTFLVVNLVVMRALVNIKV
jgi:tight adherence protein B